MGAMVFLWILLVFVAFENHQNTLVAWVLGGTVVLLVIGAMMNASSEEKEALHRATRENQNSPPTPTFATSFEAYRAARETMGRRLRYLELKYPLCLHTEQARIDLDRIESMLQRAESRWEQGDPSVELSAFFQDTANINALRMWMSEEEETAYRADAKHMATLWSQWRSRNRDRMYPGPKYQTGDEYDSK